MVNGSNGLVLDSKTENPLQIAGSIDNNMNNGIVEMTIDIYGMNESNRNICLSKEENEITLFLNQSLAFDGYIVNSELRNEDNYTNKILRFYCRSYSPPDIKLIYSKNNTSYADMINEFGIKTNIKVVIQDNILYKSKSKLNMKADNFYKAIEKIKKDTGTKAVYSKNEIKFININKNIEANQVKIPPKNILRGGLSATPMGAYGRFFINCKYTPVNVGDDAVIENTDYIKLASPSFTFPLQYNQDNTYRVLSVTHDFDYYGGLFQTRLEGY